tara:strand:+ start:9369 stop:11120 length:1752 start_codon:yes stop_codon:yes gene_type:complete
MKIKNIMVLYNEKDCNIFLNSNLITSHVLTLTPDAFCFIDGKHSNILRSNDQFLNADHETVVSRVEKVESSNYMINLLQKIKKECERETLVFRLHLFLGMCERMLITIPEASKYHYVDNGSIYTCKSKNNFFLKMIIKIINDGPHLSNMRCSTKFTPFRAFINFVNKISLKLIKKKDIVLYTGNHYGLPNLITIYKNYNSQLVFVKFRGSSNNYKDIGSVFLTLISVLLNRREISFTVAPSVEAKSIEVSDLLNCIESSSMKEAVDFFYQEYLFEHMSTTKGLYFSLTSIIKSIKPSFLIAHEMKSNLNAALADVCNSLNIDSYLLSHGTHVSNESNQYCNYEQKSMSRGILASSMSKYNIIQSSLSLKAAKSFYPGFKTISFNPIMWGYRTKIKFKNNKKNVKILHAGTFRPLQGFRPWIFETSDEFYQSLKELINVVSGINNVFLTIRLRDISECRVDLIRLLADLTDNVIVKTNGSFLDDLSNSDALVSNQSTTIEEAFNHSKPVILWACGGRYSHTTENIINNKTISCPDKKILKDEIINLRNNKLSSLDNNSSSSNEFEVKSGVDDFVKFSLKKGNIL